MRKWEIITPEHNLYYLYQILRGKTVKEVEANLTIQSFTEIMERAFKILISHQLFVNSRKCEKKPLLQYSKKSSSFMHVMKAIEQKSTCKKGDMKDEIIST